MYIPESLLQITYQKPFQYCLLTDLNVLKWLKIRHLQGYCSFHNIKTTMKQSYGAKWGKYIESFNASSPKCHFTENNGWEMKRFSFIK